MYSTVRCEMSDVTLEEDPQTLLKRARRDMPRHLAAHSISPNLRAELSVDLCERFPSEFSRDLQYADLLGDRRMHQTLTHTATWMQRARKLFEATAQPAKRLQNN